MDFDKMNGLVPAIIQDADTAKVLMLGFMNKEAYDKTGLIYGIGHAVYTLSDPRAVELKRLAGELAKEKGREDEYNFLKLIEQEGIKCLQEHRGGSKQRVRILISTVALSMK